jgi:hypothetical protein
MPPKHTLKNQHYIYNNMALTLANLVGTVLVGNKYVSIINTVGLAKIIKTITTTTSSICSILSHISRQEAHSVKSYIKHISELQLEYTVNVIEQLVIEQEATTTDENETHTSIKIALVGVHEILDSINSELKGIKESVDYHNTKWISGWRSFDCPYTINTLTKQKNDLIYRYKMLIDLLQIYNK